MSITDDLVAALRVRLGATSAPDEKLQALIGRAVSLFEDQTGRNLAVPEAGDPDVVLTFPVSGAVAKIRDARSITTIEVASTRLAPVWLPAVGVDVDSHYFDGSFVYLNLDGTSEAVVARVTGKFGLFGLAEPPRVICEELVTLAAHLKRSEGAEGSGSYEMADDGEEQNFDRLPRTYTNLVRKWAVPDPSELRLPFV